MVATRESVGAPTLGRRTDLDWLRIIAFGILILYHVECFYGSWPWRANSQYATWKVLPLLQLSTPWRLLLLFVISGVATRFMMDKTRPADFLRSRAMRLLIPLAFGMLVIVPPQTYIHVLQYAGYTGNFASFYPQYLTTGSGWDIPHERLVTPEWAHLWFIAYLFVFTLVTVAVGPRLKSLPASAFAWFTRAPWIFVVPIVLIALANTLIGPFSTVEHLFFGDWRNLLVFCGALLFGYGIAKHEAFFAACERYRYVALVIAASGYAAIGALWLAGADSVIPGSFAIGYALFNPVQGWATVVAAFGFSRRHLRRDSPLRRYLTDAVFPYYIIHQTTIVVAGYWLTQMDLPMPVEATLLILITVASCLIVYEVARRVWILRPLFGLKLERASTPASTSHRTNEAMTKATKNAAGISEAEA